MDETRDYHTKLSKSEKEKYICLHAEYYKKKKKEKKVQMNVFTKQKETLRLQKQTYGYQNGKAGGRGGKDKLNVSD